MSLKPQNLIQAAEADLKRKAFNAVLVAEPGRRREPYKQYAFHRKHVGPSGTIREIFDAALADPDVCKPIPVMDKETGEQKKDWQGRLRWRNVKIKRNTKHIYAEPDIIVAALNMLEE